MQNDPTDRGRFLRGLRMILSYFRCEAGDLKGKLKTLLGRHGPVLLLLLKAHLFWGGYPGLFHFPKLRKRNASGKVGGRYSVFSDRYSVGVIVIGLPHAFALPRSDGQRRDARLTLPQTNNQQPTTNNYPDTYREPTTTSSTSINPFSSTPTNFTGTISLISTGSYFAVTRM